MSDDWETADSIAGRFAVQVRLHAGRPAVCTTDHQWTYAQLDDMSDRVAAAVGACGGDSPAPVALMMAHDAPLIAAILGVLKSGRPYVVLDGADVAARRHAVYAAAAPGLLIADEAHRAASLELNSPSGRLIAAEDALAEEPGRGRPGSFPTADISPDSAASITFTSGTTGGPKGVWHSHRTLLHHCRNYTLAAGLGPTDRLSLAASCTVTASMSNLWGALLNGGALFPFDLRLRGAGELAGWLGQQRLTVLHCVPTVFRLVGAPLPSLRLLRMGGESIYAGDVEGFKRWTPRDCRLLVALSSTETLATCMMVLDHDSDVASRPGRIAVGWPTTGAQLRLEDEAGRPVPAGQIGRIVVRSRYLAGGYWGRPDLTTEHFAADPDDAAGRTFRSADLGRFDAQGRLEYHGRADAMIKIAGQRIDAGEVEAAMLSLGLFEEVAVAADERAQPASLVAYVGGVDRGAADAVVLRRKLGGLLPRHMIPSAIVALPRLPRTAAGKIDLRALPRPAPAQSQGPQRRQRRKGRDPLEKQIEEIWRAVLQRGPIGLRQDFFADLGGTSLQAVAVVTGMERSLGARLPLSDLMNHRTIESLARRLDEQLIPRSPSPLLRLKPGTTAPLFLFHRGNGGLYGYGLLLEQLAKEQTVYGLQCVGLQGERWPLSTLGAMAGRYVEDILTVDARGPYFLGGICMGGLIALEAGQQLIGRGRQVAFLGLFDTTHPAIARRGESPWMRTTERLKHVLRVGRWRAWWAMDRATAGRLHLADGPPFRRLVSYVNTEARRRYRPMPYAGAMDLFVGDRCTDELELERRLAVGRVARGGLRVHRPAGLGDDLLMPPAVSGFGRLLQSCIDAASDSTAQLSSSPAQASAASSTV